MEKIDKNRQSEFDEFGNTDKNNLDKSQADKTNGQQILMKRQNGKGKGKWWFWGNDGKQKKTTGTQMKTLMR